MFVDVVQFSSVIDVVTHRSSEETRYEPDASLLLAKFWNELAVSHTSPLTAPVVLSRQLYVFFRCR